MSADNQALDQVRTYLATLPQRLRSKLVSEIEAQRLKGTSDPAQEVVLEILRTAMQSEIDEAKRSGTPERVFSEPLEPFLLEDVTENKHKGFIWRKSLDSMWRWLQREPSIRDSLEEATDAANKALLEGDDERAAAIMARLRGNIIPVIDAALSNAAADHRKQMHLTMQLDGPRCFEDLRDIATVLRLEERINRVVAKLPAAIADLDDDILTRIVRRTKDAEGELIYLLIPVFRRLEHPIQILNILTEYEETDDGRRLISSRFAPCAEIVLTEAEHVAERMAVHIGRPAEFDLLLSTIQRFYALANGFSVGLELDGAPAWHGRLSAQRKRASEILSAEVERIPGAVRRAMRPRRRDGEPQVASDEDVEQAVYAVRLMVGLKPYRGELAVNERLATVTGQVEKFIESANRAIVQDIRSSSGAALANARRELDTAVRINTIVFGEDFAALLKRSGEAAEPVPSRFDLPDDDDDEDDIPLARAPAA